MALPLRQAAAHLFRRPPPRPCLLSPTILRRCSTSAQSAQPDHYATLGIPRNATQAQIKKAYYTLAKSHHPDSSSTPDPTAFANLSAAYQTLSDPKKRQLYDIHGIDSDSPHSQSGPAVEDILREFSDFFSGAAQPHARPQPDRPLPGDDKQTVVTLTLQQAFSGHLFEQTIPLATPCKPCNATGKTSATKVASCPQCNGQGAVPHQTGLFHSVVFASCPRCASSGQILLSPCPSCAGNGVVSKPVKRSIRVPAGAISGMVFRVPGAADAGIRQGPPGDLFVHVSVEKDPYFHRKGRDLHVVAPLSLAQAALGGDVVVRTMEGDATVKVPSGTQSDDTQRMPGRGMPGVDVARRGDQIVHFKVVVPQSVDGRKRELLQELLELEDGKIQRVDDVANRGLLQRFQRFLRVSVGGEGS